MAKMKTSRKSDLTNVVGAGAAGGGIGTVIAAIANNMPDDTYYKSILTVSAPLITIGISGLWLFLKSVYIDPFTKRKKHEAINATMDKILFDARSNAERVLHDPNASNEHKRDVRKTVESLELLRMKKIVERMEIVAAD